MNSKPSPYQTREAVPLYFYPFLSPLSCTVETDDVAAYAAGMEAESTPGGRTLIYIHIPFCKSICHFCGFYRDAIHEGSDALPRYVEALGQEMEQYGRRAYTHTKPITAIYFGGGTPTMLSPAQMETLLTKLHQTFRLQPGVELSCEGEVRTLKDRERLSVLRDHGCTRVSFGVQTFNERARTLSGLKPSLADIRQCIDNSREFGYSVNLDLMYGLPGQTPEVWARDLYTAVEEVGAANIDIYDTVLYPHTILFQRRHKLKKELADQNVRLEMMLGAMDYLAAQGYEQNTIEDFNLPGRGYAMKKLVYGGGDGRSEIIALGASAVGLVNGFSYRNLPPQEYMSAYRTRELPPVQLMYRMQPVDYFKRALVFFPKNLRLQKQDVDLQWLEGFRPVLQSMHARDLITETETGLGLTRQGHLWTDNIAMEFLEHKEQQKIWKIGY